MNQLEQYDQRIARIMAKIDEIKDKKFSFTCGKLPPVWEPLFSEEEVAAFEAEKGIRYFDLANDCGIIPMRDKDTENGMD